MQAQHAHTHRITGMKINFDHLYVTLPHNAQQETKHRDTDKKVFSIIYKWTTKIHNHYSGLNL